MDDLKYYADRAKEAAKTDTNAYTDDPTYRFVKQMFEWRHPERSTYNREAACIVLIRKSPVKGEKPRQIWLPTYRSSLNSGERAYSDNFDYITRVIKALSALQEEGKFNLFMSYGTFRYEDGYNRTQAKAYKIKAIGIDLDFNKLPAFAGLTFEESLSKIKELHSDTFSRYTPMIVRSGGGCQLYFLLNRPIMLYDSMEGGASETGLERFRQLSAYFNCEFADCGSDSHCKGDTARIFRVPGTFSLKYDTPRPVRLEAAGRPHGYRGIVTLPEAEIPSAPPQEAKPAPKGRTLKAWTGHTTAFDITEAYGLRGYKNIVETRIKDLEAAIEEMQGKIEGYRNQTIFVAAAIRYAGCRNYSQLLSDLLTLNQSFDPPLPEFAVEEVLRNVIEKSIKVSNIYIYETLYQPWETDLSKLKGLYTVDARKKKDRQRKPKRKAYTKEEKLSYIRAHPDMKNADIAAALMCSVRTIQLLRKAA